MIQFGTGGWRAQIGRDFYYDNICKVAYGIARMMQEDGVTKKPFPIGYDRRFLSQEAAGWIAEVLAAQGIPVWFMPRSVPTPLVMFLVQRHDLYYGAGRAGCTPEDGVEGSVASVGSAAGGSAGVGSGVLM